jgi:hypothetical protein
MENFNNFQEALDFIVRNQRKIDSYNRKIEYICNYQKEHPEKAQEKCKRYYEKLKDDPEKYQAFLEKKRNNYRIKNNLNVPTPTI